MAGQGHITELICRQIVASVDDESAGPSYSVTALSEALRRRGANCKVLASGRRAHEPGLEIFAQDMTSFPIVNRLMMSGGLAQAMDSAALQGAVLHAHGLWLLPNLYPSRVARRRGVPLVVSPRGMLGREALAFSPIRKRVFWILAQARALRAADCFHATSEAECDEIRRAGLDGPVAVIPNGINIPSVVSEPGGRTILHLSRLHPKKGVNQLVAAWARVANAHSNWRLRIVGPSELGYRAALEAQVTALGAPRVEFCGALHGDAKWQAYRDAGLFVLPTLNENFGMVVAEALAAGVPTICTKGAPWQGLAVERCGWWIDQGPEPIAVALEQAMRLSDNERAEMGQRGRDWMDRDFGWDGIAKRMAQVYAWCLGKGDKPDCVTE